MRQVILLLVISGLNFTINAAELKTIDMASDWGIKPVHLRVTADGYMVEFRYKILDTEKALILSDRKDFPYLKSMKSRARLTVPFFPTTGFQKSSRRFVKKGKNYTAMFSNENKHMLPGDKARIEIKNQASQILTLQ